MLTGDKFETAENIGMSCRLISNEFIIYKCQVVADVYEVCSDQNLQLNNTLMLEGKKRGIIITAEALTMILADLAI